MRPISCYTGQQECVTCADLQVTCNSAQGWGGYLPFTAPAWRVRQPILQAKVQRPAPWHGGIPEEAIPMEHGDELSLKTNAISLITPGAEGDGAGGLLDAAPFAMRPLLLPLPPTGSAVFAQAWTRRVVALLLGRQLAQAWVAVASAFDGENELLHSRCALTLQLLLASGKLGSRAGLPGGLPRASMGLTGLLPRLYGKGR